jgi:hypothetical protein
MCDPRKNRSGTIHTGTHHLVTERGIHHMLCEREAIYSQNTGTFGDDAYTIHTGTLRHVTGRGIHHMLGERGAILFIREWECTNGEREEGTRDQNT